MCLKLLLWKVSQVTALVGVAQVVAAVLDISVEPTVGKGAGLLWWDLVSAFLGGVSCYCFAGGHHGGVWTPDSMLV